MLHSPQKGMKETVGFPSQGRKIRFYFFSFFGNLVMIIFSFSCLFPVIWLFYASLNTQKDFNANPVSLPKNINIQNYIDMFEQTHMAAWMLNTIRNTAISLFFILLFGFIIGYFLSRFRFRGRNLLYAFFLFGIVIPIQALMVPMYVLFKQMNLIDHWFTLPIPYIAFGLPVAIFLVESYIHTLPHEMEEAAIIDGCSFTRMLFGIIFPMCLPILIVAGIIQLFSCWNEFSFALVLINSNSLMTVPVGMTLFKGTYSTNYPLMMAAMFISLLPALILYFLFSKQIIRGMVTGAVKG